MWVGIGVDCSVNLQFSESSRLELHCAGLDDQLNAKSLQLLQCQSSHRQEVERLQVCPSQLLDLFGIRFIGIRLIWY